MSDDKAVAGEAIEGTAVKETENKAVVDKATETTTTKETSKDTSAEVSKEVAKEVSEKPATTNQSRSRKRKRNNRNKNKSNRKKQQKGKPQPNVREDLTRGIRARFAACGRCCYFLGSYTSVHGVAELETAVKEGLSDWLTLTWDHQTRMLVHKAFGVQLDVDYYFYEGCCVACSRQFSFKSDEEGRVTFRVKL